MKVFEEKYHQWEKLRLESKHSNVPSESITSAAFDVYQKIMVLKRN